MKPSHLHQRSHTHRRKRGVLVRYASLLFGLVLFASLSACDSITVTPAWEEPLETPEQRAEREAAQEERLAAREAAQAERRAAQEERRAAKEAAQEAKRVAKETGTGEEQQSARRLLGGNQDADKEAAREEKRAAREAARQERLAAREAAAQAKAAARGEETVAQGEEAGTGEEQQSVRRLFGGNTDPDKEAAREEKQAAREAARQERLAAKEAAAQARAAARAAAAAQGAVTDAQGAAAGVGAGQRSARRLRGGNADPDKEAAREEKRAAREAARQERLAAREAARQKRLAAKEATRAGDGAPEEMETAADAGQMARIGELLALGDEALKNDRLTVPAGESAVDRYNQILEIDPNNDGAKQGIDRVVDRYIVLARGAMDDSNWPRAKQMASRAGSVGPHRSEPGELEQQIDLMSQVTSDSIEFAQADVRNQDEGVANQILAFGAVAKYKGARVEIRTPNNKDGRWMFDQLNEAPGEGRVRAFFTNGSPPKITLSGGE